MARRTLFFYFLQFLPVFASANAGFNGWVANCIDFDMANIEEMISELRTVENSEIKAYDGANENEEKNRPFGDLKHDWSRLQLLQEALPTDSLLKDKFKHIFRLLLIAHDQATRFLDLPKTTKMQDAVEKETTITLSNKNHTVSVEGMKNSIAKNEESSSESQEMRAKLKNISTTPSLSIGEDFIDRNTKSSFYGTGFTTYAESTAEDGDAVEMNGMTYASSELGEAKNNNMATKITDLDPPGSLLTTISVPIHILETMKSSTTDNILSAATTIPEEGISTSMHEISTQTTVKSLSESISADEGVISVGQVTEVILGMKTFSPFQKYAASTTEEILKEPGRIVVTSDGAENSSFETISSIAITEIQSLISSSSENGLSSTTEQPKEQFSIQTTTKIEPVVKFSVTEKYSSPATISNIVPTKSSFFVSTSDVKLKSSSLQEIENESSAQSTTDTFLSENFTVGSVEENKSTLHKMQTKISSLKTEYFSSNSQLSSTVQDFVTSDTNEVFTTENILIGSPTIQESEKIELGTSNKETKNVSSSNLTSNAWSEDSAVNIPNTTSILEDPKIELTTQSYQNLAPEDIDWTENMSRVTPTIEKNKDDELVSRNNRTEAPIDEKSIFNVSATKSYMEITSNIPIDTQKDGKSEVTSLNNETEKSMDVQTTFKNWYTTDFIKSSSIVTSKVDNNQDNKSKYPNNQTEPSTSENSTIDMKKTTDDFNHVTSSIENDKIDTRNKHKDNEISVSEKSTSSEWSNDDSTESVQITIPTLTMNEEIKSTESTENNETTVTINDESIYKDNDSPSTSTSTSALNTSTLLKSTVPLVAETSVLEVSHETTKYFLSMEPSIKTQKSETSRRNSVSEKSTITTEKIKINIPTESELTNQTEVPEADLPARISANTENDLEITSKKSEHITTVTENPEPRSDSENWRTNFKPSFVKNALNTGSSRSNKIFQDFKHDDDSDAEKNAESPQIVLYETGAGAKTGSVWRPHLERQKPTGNNIWKFDGFPNVGPYGYGHKQSTALPINFKTDISKNEKNPAKFPGQGSRTNLLRSRKRGSANSDVEKQFRWFYRHGRKDPAHESRVKENVNTKVNIQCKKNHQR